MTKGPPLPAGERVLLGKARVAREGVSLEVVDLRTISPLDMDTVAASVAKTGCAVPFSKPLETEFVRIEDAVRKVMK